MLFLGVNELRRHFKMWAILPRSRRWLKSDSKSPKLLFTKGWLMFLWYDSNSTLVCISCMRTLTRSRIWCNSIEGRSIGVCMVIGKGSWSTVMPERSLSVRSRLWILFRCKPHSWQKYIVESLEKHSCQRGKLLAIWWYSLKRASLFWGRKSTFISYYSSRAEATPWTSHESYEIFLLSEQPIVVCRIS